MSCGSRIFGLPGEKRDMEPFSRENPELTEIPPLFPSLECELSADSGTGRKEDVSLKTGGKTQKRHRDGTEVRGQNHGTKQRKKQ